MNAFTLIQENPAYLVTDFSNFFDYFVNVTGGETSDSFSDAFALSWTTFSTVSLECALKYLCFFFLRFCVILEDHLLQSLADIERYCVCPIFSTRWVMEVPIQL